jgi:hypothetical protein
MQYQIPRFSAILSTPAATTFIVSLWLSHWGRCLQRHCYGLGTANKTDENSIILRESKNGEPDCARTSHTQSNRVSHSFCPNIFICAEYRITLED